MTTSTSSAPPDEALAKYEHLTLVELLRLYTGPGALPCSPELCGWIDAAIKWRDFCAAERRVRELEKERA